MKLYDFAFEVNREFYYKTGNLPESTYFAPNVMDWLISENPNLVIIKDPLTTVRHAPISTPQGSYIIKEGFILHNSVLITWDVYNESNYDYLDILYNRLDVPIDLVRNLVLVPPPPMMPPASVLGNSYPYNVSIPNGTYVIPTSPSPLYAGKITYNPGNLKPDLPTGCAHNIKEYHGFTRIDYFCTKCNQKWDTKP